MNPQVLAYLPLLTPIATLMVVIVGVFFSNHHVDVRISDLRGDLRGTIVDLRADMNARFADMNVRFADMNARLDTMDRLFQERLRRVEEILDARLSRIEQELHLK